LFSVVGDVYNEVIPTHSEVGEHFVFLFEVIDKQLVVAFPQDMLRPVVEYPFREVSDRRDGRVPFFLCEVVEFVYDSVLVVFREVPEQPFAGNTKPIHELIERFYVVFLSFQDHALRYGHPIPMTRGLPEEE
jgi:hypothetical protein